MFLVSSFSLSLSLTLSCSSIYLDWLFWGTATPLSSPYYSLYSVILPNSPLSKLVSLFSLDCATQSLFFLFLCSFFFKFILSCINDRPQQHNYTNHPKTKSGEINRKQIKETLILGMERAMTLLWTYILTKHGGKRAHHTITRAIWTQFHCSKG